MLTPDQVTAVIVTKGDVDLAPVLESLIFDDVVIYDNSGEWWTMRDGERLSVPVENEMTYARALAPKFSQKPFVYSQDDDIVHSQQNQRAILAAYEPGVLTGCMWDEWNLGAYRQGIDGGYDDLVFPGSGSIVDHSVVATAINRYLEHFPLDDFFRLWCDTIVGVIAPTKQLDIRFDALPCAEDAGRMCNLPDAVALKTEAIRRARWVRDEGYVRAIA